MRTSSIAAPIDESSLPRRVLDLAWPVVAEQTFVSLVGMASAFMVGHLGAAALAGVGLASQVVFLPQVLFVGLAVGATAIIARRIGEGEPREASLALNHAILLSVIVGLIFTPLVWLLAEPSMVLLQAQPDTVQLGTIFTRASAPGLIPSLIMFGANAAMRGAGNTRTPMLIMFVANLANITLGYVLIYGLLGLPPMGVLGAGIAASIAWLLGGIVAMAVVIRGVGVLRYDCRRAFSIDRTLMGRILRVGSPAALEQLQFQVAFSTFSAIVSGLGTAVFAAQTVALRVENLVFMIGYGFGVAATTLVGQALGAGRPDLAQRATRLAQWYAIGSMTCAGIFMGIFRTEIMSVFISDREVTEAGAQAMLIYAFSMPLMGLGNCLSGGLRGAGDTRAVLFIMTAGVWLIRVPFAYFLAYWVGLGGAGAWMAATLDINVRGVVFWWRFAAGHWKTIKV